MPQFYTAMYTTKEEIPQDLWDKMQFGLVISYGSDTVTGWCSTYYEKRYSVEGQQDPSDSIGIKIVCVILEIDGQFYHHAFLSIIDVPVIFFPKA